MHNNVDVGLCDLIDFKWSIDKCERSHFITVVERRYLRLQPSSADSSCLCGIVWMLIGSCLTAHINRLDLLQTSFVEHIIQQNVLCGWHVKIDFDDLSWLNDVCFLIVFNDIHTVCYRYQRCYQDHVTRDQDQDQDHKCQNRDDN